MRLLSCDHLSSHDHLRNRLLSYNRLCQPDTEMDIRESFSKLKKRFKHQGSKGTPDKTGVDSGAESVDPGGSLSRPVPHVVTCGSHNQGDGGANTDRRRVLEFMSVRGSDYPSPSTPSIAHSGKPDGAQTLSFRLPLLIIPSDTAGTSTVPYYLPDTLHPNESIEWSTAVGVNKPDWRPATAKLLLHWARDSADAFGPLKSVTGGLSFILQNFEVCPSCILCW